MIVIEHKIANGICSVCGKEHRKMIAMRNLTVCPSCLKKALEMLEGSNNDSDND